VAAMATSLGVDLSERADEFFLLPLVVEACRAPLPGGWSELLIDGVVHYVEESTEATPQLQHPPHAHFAKALVLERLRTRRRREAEVDKPPGPTALPRAMQHAADRWMLFVDAEGVLYYHNFATGHTGTSLHQILYESISHTQMHLDVLPPLPPGAAAPTGEAPRLHMPRPPPSPGASLFGLVRERMRIKERDESGPPDDELRSMFLEQLHERYRPLLAMSVATSPRAVLQTLETARAYQIHPVSEMDLLWVADLALSLPVPAGWVHAEHPTEDHHAHFWHNLITGSSQWGHPVDDFIKACIKNCRAPSHPQVRIMRAESIARTTPTLLSGESVTSASTGTVERFERELSSRNLASAR